MEQIETIKALNLVAQTLKEIETLSIDKDIKEQLISKVLETVGIEKPKARKRTPGSQEKIIEFLRNHGGTATRAEIASDSGIDPNVVSSLLNGLVKSKKVNKVSIDRTSMSSDRTGRGLAPEYMYKLVDEENGKVQATRG
jgi:hypothetical protein